MDLEGVNNYEVDHHLVQLYRNHIHRDGGSYIYGGIKNDYF